EDIGCKIAEQGYYPQNINSNLTVAQKLRNEKQIGTVPKNNQKPQTPPRIPKNPPGGSHYGYFWLK
ncbi:hypothetical protein ACTHS1_13075, partial [Neisseria sp. P0014.S008]|uniref:hypothetical protein n=1 Tax=Neisseria sp. P0014.S008 TaxID=3436754 RepID=UPI003F7F43A2